MKVKFGEIGYITFKRTYARKVGERTEEFEETVERELSAFKDQLGLFLSPEDENTYRRMRYDLKISPAGRFMWQLGTKTVDKLGLPSLQNCAFTVVDSIRSFTWTFDMLMLGSGVGFSIQRKHISKLPTVTNNSVKITRHDSKDADFIVPDTREGWVKLLGKVLKHYFYGGKGFSYSTQLIRGKGAPISGFGGVASGPEELCKGIADICAIMDKKAGQQLSSVDCLDIMNIIGEIVVSGNIRRSAQIAIGDPDDVEYLRAKRWSLGNIPNWRSNSNNSVVASHVDQLSPEFWETYEDGEPYGIINIELAKKTGRTGDFRYPDPDVEGFNPCAEQGLADKETCCLAEIYLPNIESREEMFEAVELLYKINKHSLMLHCHNEETESIVHKNMRMGIGVTGVLMAKDKLKWLSGAYEYLRNIDDIYSEMLGVNRSIKLTTVKPSGTLSLLAGVTPGVHPSPAGPYYIRRIRIASDSNLIPVCRKHGYHVEPSIRFDGSEDYSTMVVSFPCKVPVGTPVAADFSWKEQMEMVMKLQEIWSDNSVSCTVYYKKEDIPEIKEFLAHNLTDKIKTVSFMLYHGHGFVQAPYETITEERYNEMIASCTPIESVEIEETDFATVDCEGGACPIK